MPELPEVEVVRRGLDQHVVGRTFQRVEVLHPRAARGNTVNLEATLPGLTITGTGRRGKYMWFTLSDGAALLVHLRMSGQMLVANHGTVTSPHLRIRADVGEVELDFVDQRTFGFWQYTQLGHGIPHPALHIAPDPFEPDFDVRETARAMRRRKSPLKNVLLNQEVVSGIGSIYADEAAPVVAVADRGPGTPHRTPGARAGSQSSTSRPPGRSTRGWRRSWASPTCCPPTCPNMA